MEKYYRHIVLLVLLFSSTLAFGQKNTQAVVQQKMEELTEKYDLNIDFSDVTEMLYYYYNHPLNLNSATQENLKALGFLNEIQINNLLEYRKKNGLFRSIYELKDVPGFSYFFIQDIIVFFKVAPPEKARKFSLKKALQYGRSDLFLRYGRILEEQKGYAPITDSALAEKPNSHYLGRPDKIYFRYRYTYRDKLSIGLVGDKDAGEEFFTGNNKAGFDFYSGHIFLRDLGRVKSVVLGDYHCEFGQGLTLWSGLGFGKSVDVLGVQKVGRGIRPSTSANENLYFRGAATTIKINDPINLTVFYSNKGLDAGLTADTLNAEELYFQSIQETGMHRTPNEVAKKRAVNEQIYGGNISYNNSGFHMGITAYKTLYDKDLKKDLAPYQIFDFQGKDNFNMGLDFSYSSAKVGFFGEFSLSQNKGYAMIGGLIANLSPRFKTSLLYRDFAPNYQVVYAIPFAEGSNAKNERGLFAGALAYLGNSGMLSAYYDLFSFPWLRYRVNTPSQGNEFLIQYQNEVSRYFNFYLRVKSETKMLNYSNPIEFMVNPTPVEKRSIRYNMRYAINHEIILKSRIEISQYQHFPEEKKEGYLLYQDIQYKPEKRPFDMSFRYALFNTDDYDTRIYAYESDVLYKFSVPAYAYQGQRYYLLFHWDVMPKLDFWLRFSQTIYFNRDIIGTGLEEIDGNKRSEITAQIRWKF